MRDEEDKPRNLGDAIAYRIRAELVCCDLFDLVHQGRVTHPDDSGSNHGICYWGEASATLAESVGQIHEQSRQRQRDARVKLVIDTLVKTMIFGQRPGELYPTIDATLAGAIIDTLDDHDRRLQAVTEHTHLSEDLERADSLKHVTPDPNDDPGWGAKPSFRCWVYRHQDCETAGPETGCTCQCHVSEERETS